jgi:hypothetical protein
MWTKHWLIYHHKYSDVNLLNELKHSVSNGVQYDTQEPHARQVMNTSVNSTRKVKKYEPFDRPWDTRQPNCMSAPLPLFSDEFQN